jgi:hypothetical protein
VQEPDFHVRHLGASPKARSVRWGRLGSEAVHLRRSRHDMGTAGSARNASVGSMNLYREHAAKVESGCPGSVRGHVLVLEADVLHWFCQQVYRSRPLCEASHSPAMPGLRHWNQSAADWETPLLIDRKRNRPRKGCASPRQHRLMVIFRTRSSVNTGERLTPRWALLPHLCMSLSGPKQLTYSCRVLRRV